MALGNPEIHIPEPHQKQGEFIYSPAKRKIVKAGRRSGKTVGLATVASLDFIKKRRVLYASPTTEQISRFWATICRSFQDPIERKILYKNETEHFIERRGTEQRIKAKTAWNADTLRGDYADLLILDEWQLMDEDAWELVGAPMLLDNDGDVIFSYTPPSLHSRSVSKAKDPQHAAKMFAKYQAQMKAGNPRYAAFHFKSHDNPYISVAALNEITQDMTALAYRMEIEAEDVNEAPGALWTREIIDNSRMFAAMPDMERIVVGVDPSATSMGDEAGIIVAGKHKDEGFVLADRSVQGSPLVWAREAVAAYRAFKADRIVAESNQGGEMVELTIHQVDGSVPVKLVHASRGKQTRAEPISAKSEKGKIHHVGTFEHLEDEMCLWIPGDPSPNRMDAMVWAFTELLISETTAMVDYYKEKRDQAKKERGKESRTHPWQAVYKRGTVNLRAPDSLSPGSLLQLRDGTIMGIPQSMEIAVEKEFVDDLKRQGFIPV